MRYERKLHVVVVVLFYKPFVITLGYIANPQLYNTRDTWCDYEHLVLIQFQLVPQLHRVKQAIEISVKTIFLLCNPW